MDKENQGWQLLLAVATEGGGSERERAREPTCSRKRNGRKEGGREGEKSFCCPSSVQLRERGRGSEIDKDSKHRTRTTPLSCHTSATDAKIDLRISSYDIQPI